MFKNAEKRKGGEGFRAYLNSGILVVLLMTI